MMWSSAKLGAAWYIYINCNSWGVCLETWSPHKGCLPQIGMYYVKLLSRLVHVCLGH